MGSVATETLGLITQIIGPVMDIEYPPGTLPNIYTAVEVETRDASGVPTTIVAEVQQLLGDNVVRAVALSATDGLMRGMEVKNTRSPLNVPVGKKTLGRIFNVLGDPVDNAGPCLTDSTLPIHRSAPDFTELDTELSIFETGR